MTNQKKITDEQKEAAEEEIKKHLADVDYDTKEYPVEVIVEKYKNGLDTDENELFVPDYQREMAWHGVKRINQSSLSPF